MLGVEEFRGVIFKITRRDPSTAIGMTQVGAWDDNALGRV